jgi:hypothetical protein
VEADLAFSRFGLEVRGGIANLERHENLLRVALVNAWD